MQKTYFNSRSVIVDRGFKKSLEDNYQIHKKKLQAIQNRKNILQNHEQKELLRQKIGQRLISDKVKQGLDPTKNEVKALAKHIEGIVNRRADSNFGKSESLYDKASMTEYRKRKNKYLENEKMEIKRQNQILVNKLTQHKAHKTTKKDLKKQFKEYQSQRNLLRKVHYVSEKPKKSRQKQQTKGKGDLEHR